MVRNILYAISMAEQRFDSLTAVQKGIPGLSSSKRSKRSAHQKRIHEIAEQIAE